MALAFMTAKYRQQLVKLLVITVNKFRVHKCVLDVAVNLVESMRCIVWIDARTFSYLRGLLGRWNPPLCFQFGARKADDVVLVAGLLGS